MRRFLFGSLALAGLDALIVALAWSMRGGLVPAWQKGPLIDPAAPYAPTHAVILFAVAACITLDLYVVLLAIGRRFLGTRTWFPWIAILLAGVLAEGATRAWIHTHDLTFFRPHPTLHWVVRPNLDQFRNTVDDRLLSTNRDGMRDVWADYEKPPGEYRILVLGDSSAFGIGVDASETLSARLQSHLEGHPSGPGRFAVLNGACPGWTTDQALRFLGETGFRYHPDLVLAGFNNDPAPEYRTDAERVPRGVILFADRRLFRLETYLLGREVLLSALRRFSGVSPASEGPKPPPGVPKDASPTRSTPRVPLAAFLENLRRLHQVSEERGAGFAWINMPVNRLERDTMATFVNATYRSEAAQVATELDFPYIDVDGRWLRTREFGLHQVRHLFHPNPTGQDRIAQQVAAELASSQAIPGMGAELPIDGPPPARDADVLRLGCLAWSPEIGILCGFLGESLPSAVGQGLDPELTRIEDPTQAWKQLGGGVLDVLVGDADAIAEAITLRRELMILGALTPPSDSPSVSPIYVAIASMWVVDDPSRSTRLATWLAVAAAHGAPPKALALSDDARRTLEDALRQKGSKVELGSHLGTDLLFGQIPRALRDPPTTVGPERKVTGGI